MEILAEPTSTATDVDLAAEVERAISDVKSLRATRSEIDVRVTAGHVTLTGIVPSRIAALEAERAARQTPGAAGVINQITDDGALTREMAVALASDPRSRAIPLGYSVTSFFGHAHIVGPFSDPVMRDAITEVCLGIPGVRSVRVTEA